ncbi:lysozyme inhibitor LprI family protein [Burkholderia pseudomultivorans]|uniref:Lipoprotein LprI n=1 Tax=Burkholderia pseudomultivorans TaxID=1207504 RepID=A0ABU2E3T8_9BURK|nr:lysozyme inhibitor LprI family protein [Burkholderia pseudomultivorans]MDR8729698.1 Lipoprotein LprI [Burkholderia pseudomultivorans]MDR8736965.1 Lipoprotein LprI [Burkholderia pseudomultivorans]MDR8743140.1 Lipoprotein LprI [Burkholderia pseudomultivorans]MDR8754515.1 Lipoprotein LprI [Burkholderia pseudomultivorans]MDR8779868.1 Lipoprotein LprI [Burkholderia pseudomultivorans]
MTNDRRSNARIDERGPAALASRGAWRTNLRFVAAAALLGLPIAALAAGFDCAKAASPTEKAICADAALSRLDGELATAWKAALAKGGDTGALKASQLKWLKQRDRCGADRDCLGDRYRERLASLNGAPLAADRWQQTWYRDSDNPSVGGGLTLTGTAPRLHFTLSGNNGGNTGALDGDVVLHGDSGTYRHDRCRLDFSRKGARIHVTQHGADFDCGAGAGVSYDGDYVTAAQDQARPPASLLSLKVLTDAKQDAAAHALLGADYQALVDTVNSGAKEQDLDGLHADVQSFWVRGIATTNAAIVMSRGTDLWVGLLVFDAGNKLRMRYYSNVPAWRKTMPKTIRAWHDNLDKVNREVGGLAAGESIPVDVMR